MDTPSCVYNDTQGVQPSHPPSSNTHSPCLPVCWHCVSGTQTHKFQWTHAGFGVQILSEIDPESTQLEDLLKWSFRVILPWPSTCPVAQCQVWNRCLIRTFKRHRAAFQWPTDPARGLDYLIRQSPFTAQVLPLLKAATLGSMPRCPRTQQDFIQVQRRPLPSPPTSDLLFSQFKFPNSSSLAPASP